MANDDTCCICNDWYFDRTTKVPTMTATMEADNKGLASLKGHVCTAALGMQANNCTTMTKAIAECVATVHGNKM